MARGVLLHDAALAAFFFALAWVVGAAAVAAVWLPTMIVAATIGVWLFYVQHQFDGTYWERHTEWSFVDAALHGCSYYRLPRWMHWITGNIGYHHIHHLSSRIPNYRLAQAFAEVPELRGAPSVGLWESFRCAQLALWCEDRRKLVSFRVAQTDCMLPPPPAGGRYPISGPDPICSKPASGRSDLKRRTAARLQGVLSNLPHR